MLPLSTLARCALNAAATLTVASWALPSSAASASLTPPTQPAGKTSTIAVPEDGAAYFIVTRRDLRQCVAPGCGGYYVKAVNKALTRCADGTEQRDCHAFRLDLRALGLNDKQIAALTQGYGNGKALVRGELQLVPFSETARFSVTALVASQAWLAQGQGRNQRTPLGSFYQVKDNGVRCITHPCPSYTERKLNTTETRSLAGVNLAFAGASAAQIEAGQQALFSTGGLLAAGIHTVVTGPAGQALQLVASEFYLPVGGQP